MNERIEKMVQEAVKAIPDHVDFDVPDEFIQRFAALIAADEREACAEVCDELHWPWRMGDNSGPKECASAIRARGQA